jgi:Domain of unknown function (DUF6378)
MATKNGDKKRAPAKKKVAKKPKSNGRIRIKSFSSCGVGYDLEKKIAPLIEAPKDILAKAKEIIYGDREQTYGSPGFNLKSIADFWTVYLRRKNPGSLIQDVTMEDVCQMMILLKTARLINNPGHIDSLVDQCGYAALQERVS